ncbi:hypothetical protein QQ020_22505 [Fulvivirgaceae bacterium BMA12]|uniref:Lipoprotein n=1 Tax=Agaribacillus aureus TaxID=3051825 RepID=A0ABT8LAT1_9BACT|nr:hypothetical protein [Fulvivirgaceae bacterium BMA12]
MKTLKFALLIATVVFASCSKKDEEPQPVGPSLSYSETSFTTDFHDEGNSGLPTLNWNGEVGNISLSGSTEGLYINDDNGTVHWRKSLPLGKNIVTAVATNSIGQTTVTLEIENKFMGDFTGGYNSDPNSTVVTKDITIDFKEDGSTTSTVTGVTGTGDWTIEGKTITTVLSFDGGTSFVTFQFDLTYNSQKAELKGYWYNGSEAIEANIGGYMEVKLD